MPCLFCLLTVCFVEGEEDGFSFAINPLRTSDNGGALGPNVGISGGFETYIAVIFDLCPERADLSCLEEEIRVEFNNNNGGVQNVITLRTQGAEADPELADVSAQILINNGNTKRVVVSYLADINTISVSINNVVLIRESLDPFFTNLEELFGNKFAFLGFSGSSTGAIDVATLDILDLDLDLQPSDSRLVSEQAITVEFAESITVLFVVVDSCNDPLSEEEIDAQNITESDIVASFSSDDQDGPLDADIIQRLSNGTFAMTFTAPSIETVWSLNVVFRDIVSQNMPLDGFLLTVPPSGFQLDPLGIGLLSLLIIVLVLFVVIMVRRLDRYRKQLNKHAEDIEYGRTKEQIDDINKNIAYTMNPMIAPLEELKARVSANTKLISDLRKQKENQKDPEAEIAALQEENEQLRKQMKIQKEEAEKNRAANRLSTIFTKLNRRGKDGRKDFDQNQA